MKYPAGSTRAGVLGHAGFLTLTGNPAETSPTARGLFVREHFLCQNVPASAARGRSTLPAVTAEKPMTNRERLGAHLGNPTCASCHSLIDPIGFGLESFDNVGRYREKVTYPEDAVQRDAVTKPDRAEGLSIFRWTRRADPGNSELGILERAGLGRFSPTTRPARDAWSNRFSAMPSGRHEGRIRPGSNSSAVRHIPEIGIPFPGTADCAGDVATPFLGKTAQKAEWLQTSSRR